MSSVLPSSGRQFELRSGEQRAVVVEVGAGLRSYSVDGRELLDGYGTNEMATAGRGQVLMPWPNRIEDGQYEFAGTRHQLPLNEPEEGNAIHGLVRWSSWSVAREEPDRAVLAHTLHPQPGYPFSLALSLDYSLSDQGLRVSSTAANVGSAACPFGSGAHPYLTLGTNTVDPILLQAPARTVLLFDARGRPIGAEPVEGTVYDFRQARPIGTTKLDHTFADLQREDDGLARAPPRRAHVDPLAQRELPLLPALHRRRAAEREPPQPRRRTDDMPAKCLPLEGRSPGARAGPIDDGRLGDPADRR